MKKNCLMVVNPISGALDKSEFIDASSDFATKKNLKLHLYTTSGENDIDNLRLLYANHKPERIIVAGGDGTIKMVTEAMENEDVILGILPAGSANGLAADLNLSSVFEENLEIAFGDNFMDIDIVSINNEKSIHLSDLGLNAELIKNYENSSIRGKLGYALQALTTLIDMEDPFTATIHANHQTLVCDARMIVIANSKKYGSGIVINPNGIMNDGKFELIILKNLDLIVLLKIITANMPIYSEDVTIISTDKATITTNVPVNFQMDGEYYGYKSQLDIAILSKKMRVAVPYNME